LIEGSVGESGLKNAAGMGGTFSTEFRSSIVLRMRPGISRTVCRVRGGSSSTIGAKVRGSEGLSLVRLTSEGILDMELPLRASEGEDSDETELSGLFICSSRPRARAKLVTDSRLVVLASEFFLCATLLGSVAAVAGRRSVCVGWNAGYSSLFSYSTEGDSSGRSCNPVTGFDPVGRPKSNPLASSSLIWDETTERFESRGKDVLLGVRSGARGTGSGSSMKDRCPREKLLVDDLAVDSP
jgi:hypothetical protein